MRVVAISNLKKSSSGNCSYTVHLAKGYLWWKKEWQERWNRDKGFSLIWEDKDGVIQDYLGIKVSELWKINRINNE